MTVFKSLNNLFLFVSLTMVTLSSICQENFTKFYSTHGDLTINLPNENDNIIEEWYVDEKAEIFESEEEYSFRLSLIRILDDDWNYIDNFQPIINNLIKKKKYQNFKKFYEFNNEFDTNYDFAGKFYFSKDINKNNVTVFGVLRMPGKSTYSGKLYTVIFESKDVSSQNIRKIISEIQPVKSEEKNSNFYYILSEKSKLYKEEDNRLIVEYLSKAIELDSLNPKYYYNRGYYFSLLGNINKSIIDYKKANELDPFEPMYNYGLANIYFEKEYPVDSFIGEIDKSIALDSNLPMYRLQKSYFLNQVGYYDESLRNLSNQNKDEMDDFDMEVYNGLMEEIQLYKGFDKNIGLKKQFNRSGKYYPNVFLFPKDSIKFPIKVGLKFDLIDIYNFKEKKPENNVDIEYNIKASSNYPPNYIRTTVDGFGDTYLEFPGYNSIEDDTVKIADLNNKIIVNYMDGYEYAVYDGYDDDSGVYDYSLKSKIGKFNHTFSLRDFPFDEQKILLRVTIDGDSSVYRFNERKIESDIFNVRGLDEGYFADRITYSLGYQKTSDFKYFSPGDKRALVKPYIEYNIIVSRKGFIVIY